VSHASSWVIWIRRVALCGLMSACTIQASLQGGGSRRPAASPGEGVAQPEHAGSAATAKPNIKVVGAKLEVPGAIVFQPDSALLQPGVGNEAVLGELKLYLEQNARVTRLRIEGHTNNQRGPEQSLQLSGQRALAVKQWLRENGINEGRLLAVGFGDTQPIASNGEPEGQAQNERIAFRIAELDGKPYLGTDPLAGGAEFP
jgi:outer membrane protein OmpA-like peptidoglycan-associated protein